MKSVFVSLINGCIMNSFDWCFVFSEVILRHLKHTVDDTVCLARDPQGFLLPGICHFV